MRVIARKYRIIKGAGDRVIARATNAIDSNLATNERSYYPALDTLFNAIG